MKFFTDTRSQLVIALFSVAMIFFTAYQIISEYRIRSVEKELERLMNQPTLQIRIIECQTCKEKHHKQKGK